MNYDLTNYTPAKEVNQELDDIRTYYQQFLNHKDKGLNYANTIASVKNLAQTYPDYVALLGIRIGMNEIDVSDLVNNPSKSNEPLQELFAKHLVSYDNLHSQTIIPKKEGMPVKKNLSSRIRTIYHDLAEK